MDKYEIDDRAWDQMMSLTDEEVLAHPLLARFRADNPEVRIEGIQDSRIYLRDQMHNELYEELKLAGQFTPDEETL